MLSFLAAVLVFGIIILVHEFGHFLLAKKNGIGVIEFSIGMGPRLFSFDKGETKYSLKLLPFGGSCMMMGEDESNSDPRAFNNKSVWGRISVIAAGPIFNFILAFFFAVIIVLRVGYDSAELSGVIEGYPAQEAGLQAGDVLTNINGQKITVYRDVTLYLFMNQGKALNVEYKRPVQGGYEKFHTTIVPKYSEETGTYMMGIERINYRTPVKNIGEVIKYSAYEVQFCVTTAIKSIGMMFKGEVKTDDIAGPVRMVTMIDESVKENIAYGLEAVLLNLANMCVLFSANLGIMNLLPIPALDGGRLVFLFLEVLRGKPVDKEKEGMVHMVGMMLLMALMVFVVFNDIRNLFW